MYCIGIEKIKGQDDTKVQLYLPYCYGQVSQSLKRNEKQYSNNIFFDFIRYGIILYHVYT